MRSQHRKGNFCSEVSTFECHFEMRSTVFEGNMARETAALALACTLCGLLFPSAVSKSGQTFPAAPVPGGTNVLHDFPRRRVPACLSLRGGRGLDAQGKPAEKYSTADFDRIQKEVESQVSSVP